MLISYDSANRLVIGKKESERERERKIEREHAADSIFIDIGSDCSIRLGERNDEQKGLPEDNEL